MPIFEYECTACKHKFEELVTRSDDSVACPQCSAETKKLFSTFSASVSGGEAPCGAPVSSCSMPGGG